MSKPSPISNESGEAHMVDVGGKPATATLRSWWRKPHPHAAGNAQAHTCGWSQKRRRTRGGARRRASMAAKKTAELIPLCHPIALTRVEIELVPDAKQKRGCCAAPVHPQPPARPAWRWKHSPPCRSRSCLTIYDMCKAVDRGMTMTDVGLVSKTWRQIRYLVAYTVISNTGREFACPCLAWSLIWNKVAASRCRDMLFSLPPSQEVHHERKCWRLRDKVMRIVVGLALLSLVFVLEGNARWWDS